MHFYREVHDQKGLDELLCTVNSFHDSIVKEVHLINRAYVDARALHLPNRLDAQIFLQTDGPPHAVELLFCRVSCLSLTDFEELDCAYATLSESHSSTSIHPVRSITMQFTADALVRAERLFWTPRSDWLGRSARFGPEVPAPEAIPAHTIEHSWRQCSGCSDAWVDDPRHAFSLCPTCGALTELLPDVDTTANSGFPNHQ